VLLIFDNLVCAKKRGARKLHQGCYCMEVRLKLNQNPVPNLDCSLLLLEGTSHRHSKFKKGGWEIVRLLFPHL